MVLLIGALLVMLPATGSAPPGDATLTLDLARCQVRGDPAATVLVVEFSDFKCHACEKFNLTIMPNLHEEFIQSGKAKVACVGFPLIDDSTSTTVAESVHCAGRQCLDGDQFRKRVLGDLQFAYGLGLSSRPTFFIGRRAADSRANRYRGRYVVGAQSYVVFESLITRMRAEAPIP